MSSHRSRLSVEVLEDRLVLSTFNSLDGLASDLLRFLPQTTASTQAPATTSSQTGIPIPGFSGFSGTTGQAIPNLLGFGPVDQGIPGMTATAGPANFPQTTTATTGQFTSATGVTQATVLTEFVAARLAAAQLFAVEAAQAAATTPTTPSTTSATPTTTPSAALLAAEVFFAQLQAARFAALAAQAQAAAAGQTGTTSSGTGLPGTGTINVGAGTAATGSGVFSNTGALNAFLPPGGFAVGSTGTAVGTGVFANNGGGTNAALPAGGFPVLGSSQPTQSFIFSPGGFSTQTSTTSANNSSSQGGMNPFNNALANSGLGSIV